ncbi:antibiotic biosynthesis monooxygenase family protein [Thermodesulforhabdus norvegica]|uniref:Quinol monooxygenase YgiN n=1 Tax=Thermodesulforhabdus norvegica TaxID=39841 RepID=A0A1I4TWU1_9BACT|nr:antibiotic biosynthesis monooxygenase family protein [Thermodesulforhabdus norvegica]SFM81266.1 Quinol monooxygenase YgiN [Thermodesulforhabdus norvegica]
MAIKVFIERKIEPGREIDVHHALIKLRSRAMHAPGYISGETLRSYDDPHTYLVISTWNSVEEWKRWENNPERQAIEAEIAPYLTEPPKTRIFLYTA